MQTEAEIAKVINQIDKVDPEFEDEQLQAYRDALQFAIGYDDRSADQFITHYVGDG